MSARRKRARWLPWLKPESGQPILKIDKQQPGTFVAARADVAAYSVINRQIKDTHVNLQKLAATLTKIFVASAHAEVARPERVQVVTDQQHGEVKFVIDCQPVLRVTSQGLIVSGSVIYTGVI